MEFFFLGEDIWAEFIAALVAIVASYVSWQSRRAANASEKTLEEIRDANKRLSTLEYRVGRLEGWRKSYETSSPWSNGDKVKEWIQDHAREHELLLHRIEEEKDVNNGA